MKIISWNVNGLRAVDRKNALEDIWEFSPDIFCVQEAKVDQDEVPFHLRAVSNYKSFFSSGKKKGYSGTAIYTKEEPLSIEYSFGDKYFDEEGRIVKAEFKDFLLFNIYFPNGKASKERLDFKMKFYFSFLNEIQKLLKKGKKIVVCGDVNTAHKGIDLARPKENEKSSGFLPEEREWIDKFLDAGFLDAFRYFNKKPEQYTYWDLKTRARDRNVGWRIDYFFVSKNLEEHLKDCSILPQIMGSDHAPVVLQLEL